MSFTPPDAIKSVTDFLTSDFIRSPEVLGIFIVIVIPHLFHRWRIRVWKNRAIIWEERAQEWEQKYEALPEEEEAEPTDAELRGQVIGLQAKLDASNNLVAHYKSNPDLYWKGKYESLLNSGDHKASQREIHFLRSLVNAEAAEGLRDWIDEDDAR